MNVRYRVELSQIERCACRKSNPEILMMQPAQYRSTIDVPYLSTARGTGASFPMDRCVRISLYNNV